jgi:hypothetical protein
MKIAVGHFEVGVRFGSLFLTKDENIVLLWGDFYEKTGPVKM